MTPSAVAHYKYHNYLEKLGDKWGSRVNVTELETILDTVWKSGSSAEFTDEVCQCSAGVKLVLSASLHLWSAVLDQTPVEMIQLAQSVKIRTKTNQNVVLRLKKSDQDTAFCHFEDIDVSLFVDSLAPPSPITCTFTKLISALQIARDHSDAILFYPSDMRREKIASISSSLGFSKEILVGLFKNYFLIKSVLVK